MEYIETFQTTQEFFYSWLRAEFDQKKDTFTITDQNKSMQIGLDIPYIKGDLFEVYAWASEPNRPGLKWSWGLVIWFKAFQFDEKKTKVIGKCVNVPFIKEYFDYLWTQILQVFPKLEESEQTATRIQIKDYSGESDDDLVIVGGTYGTCRDMNIDEVRSIVRRCRDFTERGGKVPDFYRHQNIMDGAPKSYALETLRKWIKDPRFALKAT